MASKRVGPTAAEQVTFINGLNPDGTSNAGSYWALNHGGPQKWGQAVLGEGATISFVFDANSGFTAAEKATVTRAMAVWESVADVRFVSPSSHGAANLVFHRGNDGKAFATAAYLEGRDDQVRAIVGSQTVSIDTNRTGFDLSGSLDKAAGYGFGTIVHELGHVLGLGHAGAYNGHIDPARDQYSVYDDRLWTVMSYVDWTETNEAKFGGSYPVRGTYWGGVGGSDRVASQTAMQLDILAIQQLYGAPGRGTAFGQGGTTYGFHTTVTGPLNGLYDFANNKQPVLTLYNAGKGNTLDVSGFAQEAIVDLRSGGFSSVGGLKNNIAIARGTLIETAISGRGNDTLIGNGAGNLLDGGAGADTLRGLKGDDTYVVDTFADRVFEAADQGFDRVLAKGSYTLAAGQSIESLEAKGAALATGLKLVGNALGQTLIGNAGDNTLDGRGGIDTMRGLEGDDTYMVENTRDRVYETVNQGYDTVKTSVNYTLAAGQSIEELAARNPDGLQPLKLIGNAFDTVISGNAGNNLLDGKAGIDRMQGGRGDDTYVVDNDRDVVTEVSGEGRDTLIAFVSYLLRDDQSIETLELARSTPSKDLTLVGNSFANTLRGNGDGNWLAGGAGNDVLFGKGGADRFIFSAALGRDNVDHIADFASEDEFALAGDVFASLAPGALSADAFKMIDRAKVDANDRILYKQATGEVFYDADGAGQGAAVLFAVLDNKATLTGADFLVL